MLEMRNITKSFTSGIIRRRIPVLKEINLKIEKGDSVGLMGSSGSGKTTLARILLGLMEADSGQVLFDGKDISRLSKSERILLRSRMQIVFQNPESVLNPRMTIRQNLLEPLEIQNALSPQSRIIQMMQSLEKVGLSKILLPRYPREISGGEAQRIVLARILSLEPELILLDEPTSMLDMSVQAQILNLLKSLQKEMGLTYLLISHDSDIVKWFCERFYTLEKGIFIAEKPS